MKIWHYVRKERGKEGKLKMLPVKSNVVAEMSRSI